MKTFLIIIGLIITLSCSKEERNEVSSFEDERLNIYTDILDDLVKNHFYNLYLGGDVDKLDEKFDRDRDTPKYQRELENIKGLVDSDTARQSTICLRHELNFIEWTQLGRRDPSDSLNFIAGLNKLLEDSSMLHEGIYDSLRSPQKQFLADRFHGKLLRNHTR